MIIHYFDLKNKQKEVLFYLFNINFVPKPIISICNSNYEVLNGYGKKIKIILHKDKSVSVSDEGRGVPVGMHASGMSTPEVIYTVLHAGGKFENSGYKVSGGLHGVGASVVNALSKWMEVTINRDGYTYYIRFENGGV